MAKNLFISCVVVASLVWVAPTLGSGEEKPLSCGNATISVSPARMRGGEQVLQDFLVTVTQPNSTKTFKFGAENDLLQVRCETNRDGEAVLLVNHYCGGSGCAESNFSIIDLTTHKVLLNANERWKGNHSTAESILGKKIQPFACGRSPNGNCYSAKFE